MSDKETRAIYLITIISADVNALVGGSLSVMDANRIKQDARNELGSILRNDFLND